MPTYYFKCLKCDTNLFYDNPIDKELVAPLCGVCDLEMTQVLQTFNSRFIGNGFASNDKGK